jgi:hypothetical protein
MNLRFYPGGEESQALQPGQRYVARIQFEPLDVHVPKGHRLMLWLFQYPYPDHAAATTPGDVTLHLDEQAILRLPTVSIDPRDVFPVPGVSFPNSTLNPNMYVAVPVLDGVESPPPAGPVADAASVRRSGCEALCP